MSETNPENVESSQLKAILSMSIQGDLDAYVA